MTQHPWVLLQQSLVNSTRFDIPTLSKTLGRCFFTVSSLIFS